MFYKCKISTFYNSYICIYWGAAVTQVVEALRYNPEGRVFDAVIAIFY
jgi:hypothetical protein